MKITALEFAKNGNGNLSIEIKAKILASINNNCKETWDEAKHFIVNNTGKMLTLWQAVLEVDYACRMDFTKTPSPEVIIKAINYAVFKTVVEEKPINKEVLEFYNKKRI